MSHKMLIAITDQKTRTTLSTYFQKYDFEIVAEVSNGQHALEKALLLKPHLMILDTGLPETDGIALCKMLRDQLFQTHFALVSTTTDFAYTAFELGAIDYLVKPIQSDRLLQSLRKFRYFTEGERHSSQNKSAGRIIGLKHHNAIEVIQQNKIIFISSENRETKVFLDAGTTIKTITTKESLKELETKLDSSYFVRTHRSFIINLMYVSKIYPSGQTYLATFKHVKEFAYISKQSIAKVHQHLKMI
ncbi:LytR/AlgR family response regulator transcription factor [Brevibacillus fluminis]|uniref:LytR/AlgR family response regulator transcription factor n=1 Tax=Brevibacillus fluminis TaxID=511487 RepID=UPI003F88CBCD